MSTPTTVAGRGDGCWGPSAPACRVQGLRSPSWGMCWLSSGLRSRGVDTMPDLPPFSPELLLPHQNYFSTVAGMCSLWPGDLEARLRQEEVAKLAWLGAAVGGNSSPSVSACPIPADPGHFHQPVFPSRLVQPTLDLPLSSYPLTLDISKRRRVITYQSDFDFIVCEFEDSFRL